MDVVHGQLKAGRMAIVTKGVKTSSSATFAPDTTKCPLTLFRLPG
jgi:hypothetical protein